MGSSFTKHFSECNAQVFRGEERKGAGGSPVPEIEQACPPIFCLEGHPNFTRQGRYLQLFLIYHAAGRSGKNRGKEGEISLILVGRKRRGPPRGVDDEALRNAVTERRELARWSELPSDTSPPPETCCGGH